MLQQESSTTNVGLFCDTSFIIYAVFHTCGDCLGQGGALVW